ncbi:GntR family transcriptional regulator [Stutzerimonas stutzeri]|uniref:GntR family transcriptional regulator n=1 Tax=Stutzerimonas stutzeri TaxID=316 RepID=A0A6I6LR45_STUST|nr:GntR family transcriptional regulator [Stutzerimonas stutzeri]QGZ30965.1 GntR family transcriptional regulator [Stutzerimonas stutzeri]
MSQGLPSLLSGGQPRYLVLAQALIDDIKAGRYPLGSLLPTEHELCQQFSVSRHTVREAIRRLSELGLISRQQGVGTRVKATEVASRYVQASEGIADLHQYVRDVRLEIDAIGDVTLDDALAELLEAKPGQIWLHVRGLRHREGDTEPLARSDVYINRAYRGIADDLGDGTQPIYALIERRYGVQVVEVSQHLSAVNIGEADARLLDVEPGEAGLQVIRKYFGANQELLEVAISLHPGSRFSYSMTQHLRFQGAS